MEDRVMLTQQAFHDTNLPRFWNLANTRLRQMNHTHKQTTNLALLQGMLVTGST